MLFYKAMKKIDGVEMNIEVYVGGAWPNDHRYWTAYVGGNRGESSISDGDAIRKAIAKIKE